MIWFADDDKTASHHVKPLMDHFQIRVESSAVIAQHAVPGDLCIVYNEYFSPYRELIVELRSRRCSTLYLLDGILEWRNSWEFPADIEAQSPLAMRPVLSDKIACIGRSQARILESWGNLNRCEVVGVARFDTLLGRLPRQRSEKDPFDILVMTARNPGFTPQQREITKRSLFDLNQWFHSHNEKPNSQKIRLHWRIHDSMADAIGVRSEFRDTTGQDLAKLLPKVDAMITTPSTSLLEGMLQGIPVALLDYHNCPIYVPAAWIISSDEQIEKNIMDLLQRPARKMLWQQTLLHDNLECLSPSTPRLVSLVKSMLKISHDCVTNDLPISFPKRLVPLDFDDHHLPEATFDLKELFPDHHYFLNQDEIAHREVYQSKLFNQRVKQLRCEYETSYRFRIGNTLLGPVRLLQNLIKSFR